MVEKREARTVLRHGHCWSCSPGSTHKPPRVSAGRAGTVGAQCVAGQPWTGDQPPGVGSSCRARETQRTTLRQPSGGDPPRPGPELSGHGAQSRVDAERRCGRRGIHPRQRPVVTAPPGDAAAGIRWSRFTLCGNDGATRGFWRESSAKMSGQYVHRHWTCVQYGLPVALGGWPEHWAPSHPTTPFVRGSPQVVFPQMAWGRCLLGTNRCHRIDR
ncbi:MAG: hypothetical protein QOJ08_1430 [Ilumatobacteraceae bacterium]